MCKIFKYEYFAHQVQISIVLALFQIYLSLDLEFVECYAQQVQQLSLGQGLGWHFLGRHRQPLTVLSEPLTRAVLKCGSARSKIGKLVGCCHNKAGRRTENTVLAVISLPIGQPTAVDPYQDITGRLKKFQGLLPEKPVLGQEFLSRKISPEKSLDFWSRKSVLRPA